MEKQIQIGVFARRNPDGSFLPSVPIYRTVEVEPEEADEVGTVDVDLLADLFYEKYKAFLTQKRELEKAERRNNDYIHEIS